jgi:hypothetical protein
VPLIFDFRDALLKIHRYFIQSGIYEVLEYESTLELKDKSGKQATFKKNERVHYLQDNIIAYQDQAWGDGEILINYRCTPGVAVDRYKPGHKTFILISLREAKNRGDIDDFNIEWGIRNGFSRKTEQWETDISHPTKRLKIQAIFPKSRPPISVSLIENTRQRTKKLGSDSQVRLPDGRHLVFWEILKPRLHENYILSWNW